MPRPIIGRHIFFESIHPFEDGNGRIGRALSELIVSQAIGQPVILALSQVIESNNNTYCDGFKGGLSASNYQAITKAPSATTTRDLASLVELRALRREGERKHGRYHLILPSLTG